MEFGIIIGSTREGRVSPQVADFVHKVATEKNTGHEFTILDIKEYDIPFVGTGEVNPKWSEDIDKMDGCIFITPEYNQSIPAPLKNAVDVLNPEWSGKVGAIVSYGGFGGVRSAGHLRQVISSLGMAVVSSNPTFLLRTEFENMTTFKPQEYGKISVDKMLDELITWTVGLRS